MLLPNTRLSGDDLFEVLTKNPSGGTVRYQDNGRPLPTSGYYVSLPVGGVIVEPGVSAQYLEQWLTSILPRCNPTFRDSMYVGWWLENDTEIIDGEPFTFPIINLEPTIHVEFMPAALHIASILHQTHIFSIITQSVISVLDHQTTQPAIRFI